MSLSTLIPLLPLEGKGIPKLNLDFCRTQFEGEFPSLRSLSVSSCEMHVSQMDLFYQSCPNLLAVEFKSIQASSDIMEKNLRSLAQSYPNLPSFKLLDDCENNDRIDYSTSLLDSPRMSIHSLTLSVTANISATVFGDLTTGRAYTPNKNDETKWAPPSSITSFNLRDIKHPTVLLDIIASAPTGLTHLTIDGHIPDSSYLHYCNSQLYPNNPYAITERLFNLKKDPLLRQPTFACVKSLSYLDVLTLNVVDCRNLFKILFSQELEVYEILKMARIVTDPTFEEQYSDNGDNNDSSAFQEEGDWNIPVVQGREKVFVWFPIVEHLDLVDTDYRRYHVRNPFLTASG
ncbi:hypothetical protein K457DRAFT_17800 [Linnemannia elongata AG-77]|uniref:Uncharacterized protein n=1 Tax=Linnemannia elongata AG-77 TaxID=1314771 RepID=A0A197K3C4_9FUNG|nr:hypothetical protein K457DRAFT_17800 [Linnemannia elongata AG-77]